MRQSGVESDYYAVLGVPVGASSADIRAAYLREVRRSHPDVAGPAGTRRTQDLNAAKRVLLDSRARADYDAGRPEPATVAEPSVPVPEPESTADVAVDTLWVRRLDWFSAWPVKPYLVGLGKAYLVACVLYTLMSWAYWLWRSGIHF